MRIKVFTRKLILKDTPTCMIQALTNISRSSERTKAGKAARIAKLISLALRIWSSSSIALVTKQFMESLVMSLSLLCISVQNLQIRRIQLTSQDPASAFESVKLKKLIPRASRKYCQLLFTQTEENLDKHCSSKLSTQQILKGMHHLSFISATKHLFANVDATLKKIILQFRSCSKLCFKNRYLQLLLKDPEDK